ncbi:MAG: Na+/H+ antiporter subunit C [Candidatus Dadabacteria bacterium]|nr:MAG: Na+/H+ antiporter subunit C [Candidatus Dadabacteria bacterium]
MTGLFGYWTVIATLAIGLYIMIAHGNLVKKVIGLNVVQTAVILFYVSFGKVHGGTAPILDERFEIYSNPLPHVLMLTAIVVGVATTAVALALIVRIWESYGSIEEDDIVRAELVE